MAGRRHARQDSKRRTNNRTQLLQYNIVVLRTKKVCTSIERRYPKSCGSTRLTVVVVVKTLWNISQAKAGGKHPASREKGFPAIGWTRCIDGGSSLPLSIGLWERHRSQRPCLAAQTGENKPPIIIAAGYYRCLRTFSPSKMTSMLSLS